MKKIIFKYHFIYFLIAIGINSCYEETATPVEASFTTEFVGADESVPVQVAIHNQSTGADTFQWTFTGASPASSTDRNPGTITYNTEGTYTIELVASNIDGNTDTFQKTITVVDEIDISFATEIIASNYPPVEVVLTNDTTGVGLTYLWTFEGGSRSRRRGHDRKHPAGR